MFLFIFLFSCAPANYISKQGGSTETVVEKSIINNEKITKKVKNKPSQKKITTSDYPKHKSLKDALSDNITVLISKKDDQKIVDQFLNIIELATYKKKNKRHFF